jgi:hypothetical protein
MVAAIAGGATQAQAAEAAGLSVREVRRRLREPQIERLVRSAWREHQRHMMAKIADAGLEAVETLRELQGKDQPLDMRLKASKELLRAAVHNLDSLAAREELDDLHAQLDALEVVDSLEPAS